MTDDAVRSGDLAATTRKHPVDGTRASATRPMSWFASVST